MDWLHTINANYKWLRTLLALFISLVTLLPGLAFAESPAEEKIIEGKQQSPDEPALSVLMEWTSVRIAEGYVLQVADRQGTLLIDQSDLANPKLEIKLRPGQYKRRIGIINKFGKISFWSNWENFKVVKTREPVMRQLTLGDHTPGQSTTVIVDGDNLDEYTDFQANAGKKPVKIWRKRILNDGKVALDVDTSTVGDHAEIDIQAKNPGKDPDRVESALLIDGKNAEVGQPSFTRDWNLPDSYTWLVPGWDQFERGDTVKAYLISGGILAFSGASLYYANKANAVAAANESSTLNQLYSNPLIYSLIIPTLSSSNASVLSTTASLQYSDGVSQYNQYKNASYTAAGMALLIYAYHLWDVYDSDSPDGLAIMAEPRSLTGDPGAQFASLSGGNSPSAFSPDISQSPEQLRYTETYLAAGYRIHF